MSKVYNLSNKQDVEEITKWFSYAVEQFNKKEFREFIGKKCIELLREVTDRELANIDENDVSFNELIKYKMLHQIEVGNDYVLVFNDTMADLSHLSDNTRAKYPDGLSIALLLEYGMGIYGTNSEEDGWEVRVNPNRDYNKKWSYRKYSQLFRSIGIAGKLIYEQVYLKLDEYLEKWTDEWFEMNSE